MQNNIIYLSRSKAKVLQKGNEFEFITIQTNIQHILCIVCDPYNMTHMI